MLRWCFLIIPFQVLCNPWEPLYFHIKQDFTKLFEKEPTVEISRESEMLPYDLGPLTYPDLTGVCNKGCDDYKVFTEDDPSQTHSACYEEYKCYIERSGVSNEEAKYITDMHNFIRAKVARGEENFGTIEGQYLPAAADMHKMVWNWELAKVAEYWARTCAGRDERYHDCNDCRHVFSRDYNVAQNFAQHMAQNLSEFATYYNVQLWWEETFLISDMNIVHNYVKNFTIGHYLLMIAANSYELGCAAATYYDHRSSTQHYESLVCNYGPVAAIEGEPLYIEGRTATICEHGTDREYLELCAPPPLVDPCL